MVRIFMSLVALALTSLPAMGETSMKIIPRPSQVTQGHGQFVINASTVVLQ